jgi:hypothetical protein
MKNFLLTALFCLAHLVSLGQYQVTIGEASDDNILTLPPVLTSDGGLYSGRYRIGPLSLRHWHADGTLDWTKAIDVPGELQPNGWACTLLPQDENLAIGVTRWSDAVWPVDNSDTSFSAYNMARITVEGDLAASWTLLRRVVYSGPMPATVETIVPLVDPDGNLVLVLSYHLNPVASTDVIELSPTGQLLWARSVGIAGGLGTDLPTHQTDQMDRTVAARCDAEGNIYVARTAYTHVLKLDKLSPTGDLLWCREYAFPSANFPAFTAIGLDHLGVPYDMLLTIDPDGTPIRAEAIAGAGGIGVGFVGVASNGDRFIANWNSIVKLDPQGYGVLAEQPILQAGQYNYDVQRKGWDLRGEWLAYAGQIDRNNLAIGIHEYLEMGGTLDLTDPEHCALFGPAIQSSPIPLELITVSVPDEEVSLPLTAAMAQVAPVTMQVSDLVEPARTDLCAVINSTEELQAALPQLVRATLLSAAEPIVIVHPDVLRTEVIDARGRVVHAGVFGASARAIATTGWEAGVYLVRGFCRQGRLLAVDRVVVL